MILRRLAASDCQPFSFLLGLMPCAPESPGAFGRDGDAAARKRQHFIPVQYHLGNALAMRELEGPVGRVPDNDSPLVWKVGIHRAWRVGYAEPLLERGPTARTNLRLVTVRQSRLEAEWNQRHGARGERDASGAALVRRLLPL